MYLAGTVVTSWSLTQDVAGSNPFSVMTSIFVIEFAEFGESINLGKTQLCLYFIDHV